MGLPSYKELQVMANPLHGLSVAELGRLFHKLAGIVARKSTNGA
jgi:hypothetical protein